MASERGDVAHISGNWYKRSGVAGLIGRKRVDRSVFKVGTTIPKSLEAAFEETVGGREAPSGGHLDVALLAGGERFPARLQRHSPAGRGQSVLALRWNDGGLLQLLKSTFSTTYASLTGDAEPVAQGDVASSPTPEADAEYIDIYSTSDPFAYRLELVPAGLAQLRDTVLCDLEALQLEEDYVEGTLVTRLVSYYERNPELRTAAIAVHGTRCQACDMSFAQRYGELGEGYIEVHHLKPVASYEGEVVVDPKEDMRVVCSNCHRMLHRDSGEPLTVEELRAVVEAHGHV